MQKHMSITNPHALRKIKMRSQGKENNELPYLKHVVLERKYNSQHKAIQTEVAFYGHNKAGLPGRGRSVRPERSTLRQKTGKDWCTARMEQSIANFEEKVSLVKRTHLQKKKRKKVFVSEGGEQDEFIRNLNEKSHKTKMETVQEHYREDSPIVALQSVCLDSQFMFQRVGSCLALLNNKLYLFGGALRRKHSPQQSEPTNTDLMLHSYNQGRWVREVVTERIPFDRKNFVYHSTNGSGRKFIVVVGGMLGDSQQTLSKFNRSILVYNTETGKLCETPWNNSVRSHASTSFQSFVVTHGGLNAQNKPKNELNVICTCPNSPNFISRLVRFETNECLAGHQMATTLDEPKSYRINLRDNNGIYLFGGEDGNGLMSNQLKILRMFSGCEIQKRGTKHFEVVETTGSKPCGRKNHSLCLLSNKTSLVVIGGEDSRSQILCDMWIIHIMQLQWFQIDSQPSLQTVYGGIYKHAAVSTGGSIVIMGGIHVRDVGGETLQRVDICSGKDKTVYKERRNSNETKISSIWSINCSNDMIQY